MSPECPYCGEVQDPPPQRKRKCRDCGQPIYIHRDGDRKTLITEQEHEMNLRDSRERHWKELSREVQRAMQSRDWGALAQAYRGQAQILRAEGRDSRQVSEEAYKCDLRRMQEAGVTHAEVSTSGDERVCDTCSALERKKFAIADALEPMPLPGCDMCRCVYIAVFEGIEAHASSGRPTAQNTGSGCAAMIVLWLLAAALGLLSASWIRRLVRDTVPKG